MVFKTVCSTSTALQDTNTDNWWTWLTHALNLIDSVIANELIIYCLLPHTTHLLQPLDIPVYKQLKNYFSTITDFITLASVTHRVIRVTVNKTNFPISFKEVIEKKVSMKMIISGIYKSGIYPLNPEAIRTTATFDYGIKNYYLQKIFLWLS